MPTYEYRCRACGHELERFQKMSDPPLRRCPSCRRMKLERLIGAGGGLVFRGPGFYATDYRSPPPGSAGDGAKGGKGEKTEKKPGARGAEASGKGGGSGGSGSGAGDD